MISTEQAALTYLLPIRSSLPPTDELTQYLRLISAHVPLVIVDGSDDVVFRAADVAWSEFAVHARPDPTRVCANGKVWGVLTGLDLVRTPLVVIADDDVRYEADDLRRMAALLEHADVVVPQNYFGPTTWHACWDTGRTLLNRVTGGDFPGTLGVRRAALESTNGYDGDVLFENLELIRTVAAGGGTVHRNPGFYVRRLPPTTRHFVGQRVRQAYDEFARPSRLLVSLAVLPILAVSRRRRAILLGALLTVLAAAETGRRTAGGRRVFTPLGTLCAPLWLLERAVCAWLAVLTRLRGGVRYSSGRLMRAANSPRELARRRAARDRSGGSAS